MLSSEFDFYAPTELSEALSLLEQAGEGAKLLAGGMSMMPAMNLGLLRPTAVVSLNHVQGLSGIEEAGDSLRIGAMTRHEEVQQSPLVQRHAPLLAQAAGLIGDVQIRHRGTIGGSVAHADPAADYLPCLAALGAEVTLASTGGERTLPASEFVLDVMLTALQQGEALVSIRVPKLPSGAGSDYQRLARVEGSFAIVNAAAVGRDGGALVAIGGATPVPVLVEAPLAQIGQAAYEACDEAYGDLNGSPEYRREMARVLATRAAAKAKEARA